MVVEMASEAVTIFMGGDWAPRGWMSSGLWKLDWKSDLTGVRRTKASVLEKNEC